MLFRSHESHIEYPAPAPYKIALLIGTSFLPLPLLSISLCTNHSYAKKYMPYPWNSLRPHELPFESGKGEDVPSESSPLSLVHSSQAVAGVDLGERVERAFVLRSRSASLRLQACHGN